MNRKAFGLNETTNVLRNFHYLSQDGLKLHAAIWGEKKPGRMPVVCLPGLTRNARDFDSLAAYLAAEASAPRQVIAFDYRGRGRSQHDPNWKNYDVLTETADVLAGLTALDIEEAAFVGTSRGGLIIMAIAAMRPAVIGAAVLNDIGPVVEGAGLAQIKAYLERAPKPRTFAEAVEIQKAANGAFFPALADEDWERMTRASLRDDNGRPIPDFDPALLKTVRGVDLDKPLPVLWPQFMGLNAVPVLAIRGGTSKLLAAETLVAMAERHPRLEAITIEGQGHAPLLETAGLPQRIATFIAKAEPI